MTKKELYCLQVLSEAPAAPRCIARRAYHEGVNTTRLVNEWAAAPLRGLRGAGFAEKIGKNKFSENVHAITKAGMAALK